MSEKKKQVQQYLATNVNIWVEPMVYEIVKKRPADTAAYALQWITNYINKNKCDSPDTQSDEDIQEVPFDESKLQKKKLQGKKRSRMGISQQVFGNFNKKESVQLKSIPKSQLTKLLILSLIRHSILFQNVDYKDEETLIDSMQERVTKEGQTIIQEGHDGDALFIVESGDYDCFKIIDGQNKYLKTYKHGDAFGELALMYNAPRAATIVVKTPGTLYSLDRITFSQIVKSAATKKRQLYRKVIDSIDIFADVSAYQKQQFYDVLKEEKFEGGQYVIQQGQSGNKFYIVLEGNLVAQKKQVHDQFPRVVYQYKEGDYFGELALLHDINRQASVKTIDRVRVASINRDSFKRMLGNFQDILKRNEERYHYIQQKITC